MNAPKEIRNDTNKPSYLYIGNADGEEKTQIDGRTHYVYREDLTHTKYTRSDLVEALVKACEPIRDKIKLRDDIDNKRGSFLWNDRNIELYQVHWRNIVSAIKALGE